MFIFYNPNPNQLLVGDCVIRGITKLLHEDWNTVYINVVDMGYSGHSVKDRMVAKLESMMDMAKSDYERQEVMNVIRSIQSMN